MTESKTVTAIAAWIDRTSRAAEVIEAAKWLQKHPGAFASADELAKAPHVSAAIADLAVLVLPAIDDPYADDPVLVTKGTLRVAARYSGDLVDMKNRLTDGRLEVARLIGEDASARSAHLALMELANSLCQPNHRACQQCPLSDSCASAEL